MSKHLERLRARIAASLEEAEKNIEAEKNFERGKIGLHFSRLQYWEGYKRAMEVVKYWDINGYLEGK